MKIIQVGEMVNIEILAQVLNCRVRALSTTHLGQPLGASKGTTWNPVVERVEKRHTLCKLSSMYILYVFDACFS